MFGEDRFGPDENYFATYEALGGGGLGGGRVHEIIGTCLGHLTSLYADPLHYDSFPQVCDVLCELELTRGLPARERDLLEQVIACHELGKVPLAHAEALRSLSAAHRLGVVSNIWSTRRAWIEEFERAGILTLFEVIAFSSDGKSMKPSARIFERALSEMRISSSEAIFIGDSLLCDVGGAAQVGMATIWIDHPGNGGSARKSKPDWIIRDLVELVVGQAPQGPIAV